MDQSLKKNDHLRDFNVSIVPGVAGGLVDVCLEERSQFSLPAHTSLDRRNFNLEKHMIGTMDGLRPLFTVPTKVIVRTVAEEAQHTSIKLTSQVDIRLTRTYTLPRGLLPHTRHR